MNLVFLQGQIFEKVGVRYAHITLLANTGFVQMDNKESETQTFEIRQGLAASFGTETNLTNLKQMDDKLKVGLQYAPHESSLIHFFFTFQLLIATVLKQVEAIPAEERNWGAIQACFLNCNAARPMQAEPITIHPDPFEVTSESNFKLDGRPDQKIIDQVGFIRYRPRQFLIHTTAGYELVDRQSSPKWRYQKGH